MHILRTDFHACSYFHVSCYSDPDLQTLLDSTHTRNLFLDDLMELKEFLGQRIHELSTESSSMLVYGQVYKCKAI